MSKKHSKFAGNCDSMFNVDGRPVYVEDLGDALKIVTPDLDSTGKQKFEVVPCEMDEKTGKNTKWKKVYGFKTLLLIDGMKNRLTTEQLVLQETADDPVQLR